MKGQQVALQKKSGDKLVATLDLYFIEMECHVCGKESLCVLPDNSDLENNSLPLCKECLKDLFAEVEKHIADEEYHPRIEAQGWEKEDDGDGGIYVRKINL